MDKLAEIWTTKREHVQNCKALRPYGDLLAALPAEPPRPFVRALRDQVDAGHIGLVAEIKRASPSAGLIRADFNPSALARAYAAGGATCLSVLTDSPFFRGASEHLATARKAVALPALRKDFILDPYQVLEARVIGADAVLLILSALDDELAAELESTAHELGLDVLLEVHDEAELERALQLSSPLIGVNNRDLKTFRVDLAVTERLARLLPPDRLMVCESGIRTSCDIGRMTAAGVRCFLVGESLMRQADLATATSALLGRNW